MKGKKNMNKKQRVFIGILGLYALITLITVLCIGVCKSPMAMKCPHMEKSIAISMGLMAIFSLVALFIKKKKELMNFLVYVVSTIAFIMNFIFATVFVCKNPDMICRTTTSPIMKIMAIIGIGYSIVMVYISFRELQRKDVFAYGEDKV